MKLTNKNGLPQPIVDAVSNHEYTGGGSGTISVTTLIDSPLIAHLKRVHDAEIEEDVSDRIYALMGSAIHGILEKADTTAITEKRLTIDVDGVKISGQLDRLALISDKGGVAGCLQDYKVCSIWEYIYGLKKDRENQLNVYAYILRQHGYKVARLQIVQIFRDWMKTKAINDSNYPQTQVAVVNVPLWQEEKQLAYIKERIAAHMALEVPECTREEKWQSDDTYAVMKEGRKTALRVLNNMDDAERWMTDNVEPEKASKHSIVRRPGTAKRCMMYCQVSPFCPYFKPEESDEM